MNPPEGDKCFLLFVTSGSEDEARAIGDAVVNQRLASAAQLDGPVESIFWWRGQVQRAMEWRCTVFTTADALDAVEDQIRSIHAYEVPQIIAVEIAAGHAPFLAWMAAEVTPS